MRAGGLLAILLFTLMTLLLISLGAVGATLAGGLFALKFKDRLHLILGFSAGAVIGVAFFDLLPEALELGGGRYSAATLLSIAAAGFVGYLILDRSVMFHSHTTEEEGEAHDHSRRGILGAGSLSLHSFLDGAAIGLAFQVSAAVGAIVAVAVLVHDFSDGINTVNVMLRHDGQKIKAFRWLLVDALAPLLGVFSTMFFTLPSETLGVILAVFAGFFLYIGASDLLPESHHNHPTAWTTVLTVAGMAVLYGAIQLAGI